MALKSFAFVLPGMLFMEASCQQVTEIASNGQSEYHIIIPADYEPDDSIAAEYLSEYVLQMTGAGIPVVSDTAAVSAREICIGNTNRTKIPGDEMPPGAYHIFLRNHKLFITGGEQKGTVYGVIDLLEHWGCRRFSPDEAYVPEYEKLVLDDTDVYEAPMNSMRVLNGKMTLDPGFADWLRITSIPEFSPPGYYVHTFNRLLPREEYFYSHPEYYAWLDTKYSFDQVCPSNAGVKELIIKKLREEMARYPEYNIWSVSQDDNFSYCRCDQCKAVIEEEGSPAGPIIRLVNEIAAVFPDKVISTLAYQFSRPAPKVTKPADNVMVMLCTIELNRSRPIAADSLSISFVKDIVDWGKICDDIYLWDYTINFNHSVSPFPNLHVLQPNLQFFYENNVRRQFPQSNLTMGLEFSQFRARLIASLLWDPYIDIDSVKTDFLQHYYGDAAPYIRKYSEHMEKELVRSGRILYIYEPPNNHADGYLSAENVKYYNELFDRAGDAVREDTILLNRVNVARLPLQYAIMEIAKNDMFGPRGWYDETPDGFILREDMRETLEKFHVVCKRNNIVTLNERSLTPEVYYNSTLRFIDVQVEGNLAFRKAVQAGPPPESTYAGGDVAVLTNGVQGAHDYNVHWLGWWGKDAVITLDLGLVVSAQKIEIGTLWDGRSWILHPASVECLVSRDGEKFSRIGIQNVTGDQQFEEVTRKFVYSPGGDTEYRYVRFKVNGYGQLPSWHASEGEPAWFFVDEITVSNHPPDK
ncbi:MAG: DUF4838 domain-containing protein [Bacteroidales bacterium]|nr:DUF4838 domain-containing protein [Bacteroidales bacterium]